MFHYLIACFIINNMGFFMSLIKVAITYLYLATQVPSYLGYNSIVEIFLSTSGIIMLVIMAILCFLVGISPVVITYFILKHICKRYNIGFIK